MRLRDALRILRKRWWLILLVALGATVSSIVFSRLQTPVYRARAELAVSPSRIDYGLSLAIENLMRQYARQLQTDKLAEAVNRRLQLDLPVEKLRSRVRASAVLEDYILVLEVDDSDPNRARDIAYVWADEFVKLQQIRMASVDPRERIEVALLDRPRPGDLYFPRTRQFALGAALLGLVVGCLLAFGLEYLDDTIKTTEDVERYLRWPVLGVIPHLAPAPAARSPRLSVADPKRR